MEIGAYATRLTLFRIASGVTLPLIAGLIARGLERVIAPS